MMSPTRPQADVSVESIMAGLIVWLARQHVPSNDRQSCTEQVERFLRWQHQRRDHRLDPRDEAYYAYLRGVGASDAWVNEARAAIARLRQYLLTTT